METNTISASLNHCHTPQCRAHSCETVPLKTLQITPGQDGLESVARSGSGNQKTSSLPQTGFVTCRLNTTSSLYPPPSHQLTKGHADNLETCTLNSYKYSKPRICVKNNFPDTDKKQVHMLRDTAILLGTKNKPAH